MCFGSKLKGEKSSSADAARPSSAPRQDQTTHSKIPKSKDESKTKAKDKKVTDDPNDYWGDSLSLSMHARHQERVKQMYPDGLPEAVDPAKATQSGMATGALGGPLGGGAGMAMGM